MLKKLGSGFLFGLGYLLSPLCWWNDLIFNLPIAYFFGWLGGRFSPQFFLPWAILGYWLSNLVGILLMQFVAVEFFQDGSKKDNLKKNLLTGLASATLYTIVILGLLKLNIIDTGLQISDVLQGAKESPLFHSLPKLADRFQLLG